MWINDTQKALQFIENNLLNELNCSDAAKYVNASESNFQRIFRIVTGFSVTEYIRLRRLSIAGQELCKGKCKVIDAAFKYGYTSPESFTKAFVHFHGITPSEAKYNGGPLKIFAPITIEMNIKGGYIMTRKLIPNVEKLYENPAENYMFPSCMRSVMGALGEDKSFDFIFFAGVTGDLFMQTWMYPKWQYNDSYSQTCHHTLVPIQKAFTACGYAYDYVPKAELQRDKSKYVQKIVESIDKGIPVLTFGIAGPPICSVIFGYDENGDVLIGWSQFTDEPHPENDGPHEACFSKNYFQKRNGLDKSDALIFIKDKKNTPSIADGIRKSILNIPMFASFPETTGLYAQRIVFGKQAFDAWADSLLDDSCFQDESQLSFPLDTYGSCSIQIGTNMHFVQEYLSRARTLVPEISVLIDNLKKSYQEMEEILQKVIEFQGGFFFEANRNALLDKAFRTQLSGLIRNLGEQYNDIADIVKAYNAEH